MPASAAQQEDKGGEGVDILAPSCGIPPTAKVSNITPMVEAVEEFNSKLS